MNILVTGFEPFNQQTCNPTERIIRALPSFIDHHTITTMVLPTVYKKSIEILTASIDSLKPDAILMLGQASGISSFHIERVAINIDDFRIADNEDNQPIDVPIYLDGPPAYFATLPIKNIMKSLNDFGFSATISNSAGTFVCNHLFYGCGYHIDQSNSSTRFGFIHVPDQQMDKVTSTNALPLKAMIDAITLAIETIINTKEDAKITGGRDF